MRAHLYGTTSQAVKIRMITPSRKTLTLSEGGISYLHWDNPQAPTLCFAHANGFNAQTYIGLLGPLAAHFNILAPDARGHGLTSLPTTQGVAHGWTGYRDDLASFLSHCAPEKFYLAGHSLGGITCLLYAASHAQRVKGLTLIEPVLLPGWFRFFAKFPYRPKNFDLATRAARRRDRFPSRDAAFKAWQGRGGFRTWPDETLRDFLDGGLIPDEKGGMRTACAPAWEATTFQTAPFGADRLGRNITCPVTLMIAEHSNISGTASRAFARHHGKTRLIITPGTTHFLPMERPDAVQEEILRHL